MSNLLNTKEDRVPIAFDPFTGEGHRKLLLYLRNWVLDGWEDKEDDIHAIRPYPYNKRRQPQIGPDRVRSPRQRTSTAKRKERGHSSHTVVDRALQGISGNRRRHHPYAKPAARAKSSLREVMLAEESCLMVRLDSAETDALDDMMHTKGGLAVGPYDAEDIEYAPGTASS